MKQLISILVILTSIHCVGQNLELPEGQTVSKESAINDIHNNNKIYWLVYGKPRLYECKDEILKKYGLQIYQIAGCKVTEQMLEQIQSYNDVVDEYMKEAYDVNWQEKLLGNNQDCSTISLGKE
jgi:hypothetical protein